MEKWDTIYIVDVDTRIISGWGTNMQDIKKLYSALIERVQFTNKEHAGISGEVFAMYVNPSYAEEPKRFVREKTLYPKDLREGKITYAHIRALVYREIGELGYVPFLGGRFIKRSK